MSTVDEIQRLCEQYINKKFGKRDKAALLEFLRGLQGQRPGDSDEDEAPKPKYTPQRREPTVHQTQETAEESPALVGVKEGTLLHKKASQYQQNVTTKTDRDRGQPVRVSDIDDVEGVKERKEKWVNEISSPDRQATSFRRTDTEETGYKVGDAEDVKKRREEWETGKVAGGIKQQPGVEDLGYKVNEADAVRKRREEWEAGKVASGVKQNQPGVEDLGYKVNDAEDVKKRRAEWESGKVAQTKGDFKKSQAENLGYKVPDAEDVKQRRAEWESGKVSQKVGTDTTKEEAPVDPEEVKRRREEWQSGKVAQTKATVSKDAKEDDTIPVDPEEVKRRREEWESGKVAQSKSSVSKDTKEDEVVVDPEEVKRRREEWQSGKAGTENKPAERKAPIQLPDREVTVADQTDVITSQQ